MFHKTDGVYEGLLNACQRVNGETKHCRTLEAAEEAFRNPVSGYHHLVIVDCRSSKHTDPAAVCRYTHLNILDLLVARGFLKNKCTLAFYHNSTLRNSKVGQYTTFVAVVKKGYVEQTLTL